ncbi:hypothetical protein EX30DRAFT_273700 [Ascodesmis nigricans]|uniref:Uncharacterized protein n=1 Tax=Ascodesmis nigricans TaxID=341454 RepID=A0A4S2MH60_9PEZI|nr:hypothetical protein EX30DRAFT_273700 [Ascodesmis nigricans]
MPSSRVPVLHFLLLVLLAILAILSTNTHAKSLQFPSLVQRVDTISALDFYHRHHHNRPVDSLLSPHAPNHPALAPRPHSRSQPSKSHNPELTAPTTGSTPATASVPLHTVAAAAVAARSSSSSSSRSELASAGTETGAGAMTATARKVLGAVAVGVLVFVVI